MVSHSPCKWFHTHPANMAPRLEMSHSGELNPMMETAWYSSRPSCIINGKENRRRPSKLGLFLWQLTASDAHYLNIKVMSWPLQPRPVGNLTAVVCPLQTSWFNVPSPTCLKKRFSSFDHQVIVLLVRDCLPYITFLVAECCFVRNLANSLLEYFPNSGRFFRCDAFWFHGYLESILWIRGPNPCPPWEGVRGIELQRLRHFMNEMKFFRHTHRISYGVFQNWKYKQPQQEVLG